MGFHYLASLDHGPAIGRKKDYIVYYDSGIALIDKKTFATIHAFHDFFYPQAYDLTDNERFLALSNSDYGTRVYDLDNDKIVANIRYPYGYHDNVPQSLFSYDNRALLQLYSVSDELKGFADNEKRMLYYEVATYPLNNLTHPKRLRLPYPIVRLVALKDSYLALRDNGQFYQLKDGDLTRIESIRDLPTPDDPILYDKEAGLILVADNTGFRVYDETFEEVNRLEVTDDKTIYSQSNFLVAMANDLLGDTGSVPTGPVKQKAHSLSYAELLDKDTMLVAIDEALTDVTMLRALDLKTGKTLQSFDIVGMTNGFSVLDKTHIGFFYNNRYMILEMDQND